MPPSDGNSSNPMDSARRLAAPVLQKRFYAKAEMVPEEGGYTLRLDGKRARTPGRRLIAVPHRHLADAIAAEWAGQGEEINPATMPVTRLANTVIDGVVDRMDELREGILAYAGTDLLCYRAGEPEGLVAQQREFWDPVLSRAEARLGARFLLAEGVVHVAQPATTLAAVGAELRSIDDPFRLAGLHLATTLTGSAVLALALYRGEIELDAAWRAAHVDEDWNIKEWGEDEEAAERRRRRFEDFRAAVLAMRPGEREALPDGKAVG